MNEAMLKKGSEMSPFDLGGIKKVGDLFVPLGSIASNRLIQTYRSLTEEEITNVLRVADALWLHSGDSKDPHAELTSGKCSNGFVDVLRALRFTNICDILSYCMAQKIEAEIEKRKLDDRQSIRWVVGSDHAAAIFSQNVARWFNVQHDFTEKGPEGTQVWKRFVIGEEEPVLQVEELMTTTGTVIAVREGIKAGNPNPVTFFPLIATLVHRSKFHFVSGVPVIYLTHYEIDVWEPQNCPLCAQGSKRLKPKTNWKELTGQI